jgi:hypothetical protein
VFEALGQSGGAQLHGKASRDTVLRLAASLEPYPASRQTFLTSPAVAGVLEVAVPDGREPRSAAARNPATEAPTVP